MANQKKAPASNQWIGTLVSAAIVLGFALLSEPLWYKILGFVFVAVALGVSVWLFRREWPFYHPRQQGNI